MGMGKGGSERGEIGEREMEGGKGELDIVYRVRAIFRFCVCIATLSSHSREPGRDKCERALARVSCVCLGRCSGFDGYGNSQDFGTRTGRRLVGFECMCMLQPACRFDT